MQNAEVEVYVAEELRRARMTVAFRVVLLLPHYVVLYFLGFAQEVVLVIGWVAALVLGRLPKWVFSFLSGYLRYSSRVLGYAFLLNDGFPPVEFAAGGYQIDVRTESTRLNRLAVLLRVVLALPATIMVGLALTGWFICGPIIWLMVLVIGRTPRPLFQATAVIFRYWTRTSAYLSLVTPAYPWGMFGDGAARPAVTDELALVSPPAAIDGPEPDAGLAAWRLVPWARRLVGLFLVLGVLSWGALISFAAIVGPGPSSAEAAASFEQAYQAFSSTVSTTENQMGDCGNSSDPLACGQASARAIASAANALVDRIEAIAFPDSAQSEVAKVTTDAKAFAASLSKMASAPTPQAFESAAAPVDAIGKALDQDASDLDTALRSTS